MSKPRTAIRRLWDEGDGLIGPLMPGQRDCTGATPVLVIPDNPTCRLSMIERTVATLWPELTGEARATKREMVEIVLATALCPSNRRNRRS